MEKERWLLVGRGRVEGEIERELGEEDGEDMRAHFGCTISPSTRTEWEGERGDEEHSFDVDRLTRIVE